MRVAHATRDAPNRQATRWYDEDMTRSRTLMLAAACTATGAAGALGAGAITSSAQHGGAQDPHHGAHHGLRARLHHAVHAEAVVAGHDGTFATVTFDRGVLKEVAAQDRRITITEGTPEAVYKDVTITLPSDARIRRDHDTVALSDLQAGDRVAVFQAPGRTLVHVGPAHAEGPPHHR